MAEKQAAKAAREAEALKRRALAIAFMAKQGETVGPANAPSSGPPKTSDNTLALLLNRKAEQVKSTEEQKSKLMAVKQQEEERRARYMDNVGQNLPPGWEAVLDQSSKRHYYWNQATNETTWTRPTGAGESATANDAGGASSSGGSSSSSSGGSGSSGSSTGTGSAGTKGTSAFTSSHQSSSGGPATTQLPAGWVAKVHPATLQTYYINTATGERSSTVPTASTSTAPPQLLGKRPAEYQAIRAPAR